jgi:outer membrane assembly lipoprotein YfiO
MRFRRTSLVNLVLFSLGALGACAPAFEVKKFRGSNEQLFTASMRELRSKHWDNAVGGFERLTLELPARDTLLPLAHFYLGKAHEGKNEYLLAAQSFGRMAEGFPNDTLADDAMYEAGRAYSKLWHRPDLDAQYGSAALATYNTLLDVYPNTPRADAARREVARLNQWFATKDYDNGMHYFRRHAYDSAIIYFKGVVGDYPTTPKAREASLRLVEAYRAIRYREDAAEVCGTLRQTYPNDREVRDHCGVAAVSSTNNKDQAPVP